MPKFWRPEPQIYDALIESIPRIMSSQRPDGQFGGLPWICRDQHAMLPLAVAWQMPESPYHHDSDVLDAIVRGGDALINDQDKNGMWTFRKKDHSSWGQIYMPWTYSRWIRTYRIIRDGVAENVRRRWDTALTLGFEGIARQELSRIHNIPTHHAMALYCAGEVLARKEWQLQAVAFIHGVIREQSPHGWWTENVGPVVAYNYVYVDALGVYYALSGDEAVLEALDRAARFHSNYTYPDGSIVETVDERNPYHPGIRLGNPGFSHTAAGRGYLAQQHTLFLNAGNVFDEDYAANILLSAGEGPEERPAASRDRHVFRMEEDALIVRRKPWFVSLSAYVCEPVNIRWRQDRQNFVSVFHDRTGLIIGGGNTKLQPLWSNCTVGDTSLLSHTFAQEEPDFSPRDGLFHVPDSAVPGGDQDAPSLTLTYGGEYFHLTCLPKSDTELTLVCKATTNTRQAVEGHITLMPHLGEAVRLSSGTETILGDDSIEWHPDNEEWLEHAGWRLVLPPGGRITWPVLPHNPYRKKGDATIEEARIVVCLPFSEDVHRYELTLSVA